MQINIHSKDKILNSFFASSSVVVILFFLLMKKNNSKLKQNKNVKELTDDNFGPRKKENKWHKKIYELIPKEIENGAR